MEDFRIIHQTEKFFYSHSYDNAQSAPFKMHAHNDYELLFVVKGKLNYTIEGFTFPLRAGDLICIKPMSYHLFSTDTIYERFNIALNKAAYNTDVVNKIFRNNGKVNLTSKPFFYQWAQRMDEIVTTYEENDKQQAMTILLDELILWLKYNLKSVQSLTEFSNNAILSKALDYINEHLDTIKSVSELTQNVFISEPYLFYLFKKHLKTTPKNYIMQKKMLQAERLILSGEKMKNVCEKLGYSDYSVFFKTYKKYFGKPPSK